MPTNPCHGVADAGGRVSSRAGSPLPRRRRSEGEGGARGGRGEAARAGAPCADAARRRAERSGAPERCAAKGVSDASPKPRTAPRRASPRARKPRRTLPAQPDWLRFEMAGGHASPGSPPRMESRARRAPGGLHAAGAMSAGNPPRGTPARRAPPFQTRRRDASELASRKDEGRSTKDEGERKARRRASRRSRPRRGRRRGARR